MSTRKSDRGYLWAILMLPLMFWACSGEDGKPESHQLPVPAIQAHEDSGVGAKAVEATPPALDQGPGFAPTAPENKTPEVIAVVLSPDLIYPGTTVRADVESRDEDGDTVTLEYEWEKNGTVLSGMVLDELDTSELRKGDILSVQVTPSDGKEKGRSKRSRPVIILNRPPNISSFPTAESAEGIYTYQVTAEDPDGDKLTYSLDNAPEGMVIDPENGRVTWRVPQSQSGPAKVRITVSDGDAKAFQAFTLNLK